MADATATFVVDLDSGPLAKGVQQGVSKLEQLRSRIQAQSKSLDALRASMQRLRGSAAVMRFEQIPKDLERAQAEADRLGAKLEQLRAKQAGNQAKGFSDLGLQKQIESVESQRGGALGKVKQLKGEQAALGGNANVKAFVDQKARAKELEGSLADLQGQYDGLGGDAGDLASKMEAPKGALEQLTGAAKASGSPLGGVLEKLQKLKGAGAAGAIAAIVAVLVVLAAAAIKAAVSIARFGLAAADAARSAGIVRSAAAGGSAAGLKDIESAMVAIRAKTAATRDEASALAVELYRAGMRGKALENAAVTIERFGVLGEETKSQVKALYQELNKPVPAGMRGFVVTKDMLPRDQFIALAKVLGKDANKALLYGSFQVKNRGDVAAALKSIGQTKFGDGAMAQMMSLSKLAERAKENIEDLFKDLGINAFLAGLHKVVMVFDQSTASGKALKKIAEVALKPLLGAGERLGPLLEAFFEGVTFGLLLTTLLALKARNAFNKLFPGSFFKDLDMAELGFKLGAAAVGAVVGALLGLAALLAVVALAVVLVALPFIILGAVAGGVIYGIVAAFDYLKSIDLYEAGANIVKGLINGIKAGAGALVSSLKGLASSAVAAFTGPGGIDSHSPSRRFRKPGVTIPQGVGQGVEDGQGDLDKTIEGMATPREGGGAVHAGGRGAGGLVVHVAAGAIQINGVTDAEQLRGPAFMRELAAALYTLALEGGGPAPEPAG